MNIIAPAWPPLFISAKQAPLAVLTDTGMARYIPGSLPNARYEMHGRRYLLTPELELEPIQPRALDLFCCAGGAARGLQLAGYHVTGIDNRPQPHYIGDVFHQADAMEWLSTPERMINYDLIWASPPCQRYSALTPNSHKANHPDLLPAVLALLRNQDIPYIVENVQGTQSMMRNPVKLCGSMFGLDIWRHRWFELGNTDAFFLLPPCDHSFRPVLISGRGMIFENGRRSSEPLKATKCAAIEIDWMTVKELDEAIPPAYSRFLGEIMRAELSEETTQ